jgi:hypothetical protein
MNHEERVALGRWGDRTRATLGVSNPEYRREALRCFLEIASDLLPAEDWRFFRQVACEYDGRAEYADLRRRPPAPDDDPRRPG